MAERVRLLAHNYSAEASIYERTWASGLKEMGRRLLERMELDGAERVVDVGAGVGALLPEIADLAPGALVLGVDISEGMIVRASRAHGRAVMDATRLGIRTGSVDAVVMAFVLFHLPDPLDGLRNALRVLRPGGRIGTATWGIDEKWPACEVWSEELDACGAEPRSSVLSQHDLVDTPEKITDLLQRAGFVDVRAGFDTLSRRFDRDHFVEFTTGMAIAKRRLESLDASARERFLTSVTHRLGGLAPEDFRLTSEVVLATARKP